MTSVGKGGVGRSATVNPGQAPYQRKAPPREKDQKASTVFVGGLRKTTDEDKVIAHFSKYGPVESVDVKRLPDGTSRGFAFVKFVSKETVDKVIEAKANHMIDNKWVAVTPHGNQYSLGASTSGDKAPRAREERVEEEEPAAKEDYEDKWSENYLQVAAQVGALQQQEDDDQPGQEGSFVPVMGMPANGMNMGMMMPMGMMGGMGMGGMGGMMMVPMGMMGPMGQMNAMGPMGQVTGPGDQMGPMGQGGQQGGGLMNPMGQMMGGMGQMPQMAMCPPGMMGGMCQPGGMMGGMGMGMSGGPGQGAPATSSGGGGSTSGGSRNSSRAARSTPY